jgi:hypothetical protein
VKNIKVELEHGETREISARENLYDYPWTQYRKVEGSIKAHAQMNRDGEIEKINVESGEMGDFIVEMQEEIAKLVLNDNNIELDEVNVNTVKNIFQAYTEDIEKLGLKLKKNQQG